MSAPARTDTDRLEFLATADWNEIAATCEWLDSGPEGMPGVVRRAIDHHMDGTRPWDVPEPPAAPRPDEYDATGRHARGAR